MVVFINGPFGVGKTTTANLLRAKLANALIFDPEEVGFMLRAILGDVEPVGDFQDYKLWRQLVPVVAARLQAEYGKTLIMPMTIWRPDYFDEILEGLHAFSDSVRVYALIAREDILKQRITGRDFAQEWSLHFMERCLDRFAEMEIGTTIDTSEMTPVETADAISTDIAK